MVVIRANAGAAVFALFRMPRYRRVIHNCPEADLPLLICRQRVIWRFTARRDCLSGSTGNDHLPNKPVVHREQAIRIPPAPDASASTVTALAPAQVVVRTVSVRLMSNCLRKPIF